MYHNHRLLIVTYATNPNHPVLTGFLLPSCKYHGLNLKILSPDKKSSGGKWRHRQKDTMLYRFLESVDDNQVILSTDAYDAWLLCGEDEILDKYHAFGTPLVFSAERNCWPHDAYLAKHYPESPTPARYLNSGGFIGTAGSIRAALKWNKWSLARLRHRRSSQYIWSRQFLQKPDFITLDTACQLFYCAGITGREYLDSPQGHEFRQHLHDDELQTYFSKRIQEQIEIDGIRITYKPTGSRPCHFHFNGPTAACMELPAWNALRPWHKNHLNTQQAATES